MSDKNVEMMKKLIQEKKEKGAKAPLRPEKNMGGTNKNGFSSRKSGGFFDK